MKSKKKSSLSHKAVVKFLIERLKNQNQIFDDSNQKSVIDAYVDYFGSNPIEDYKNRIILKKEVKINIPNLKKPKYIFPNYDHPQWKIKRMQVFRRDKFTCRGCEGNNELRCHHSYYENGKHIWEYPLSSLITMCESCHQKFHDKIKGKELVRKTEQ